MLRYYIMPKRHKNEYYISEVNRKFFFEIRQYEYDEEKKTYQWTY